MPGLDNYSATVRGGRIIVAPGNIDGSFIVDARSDLAQRVVVTGSYEPGVTEILSRLRIKEDGLIVNIGANIGLMAVYLAKQFPRSSVVAIEPNPDTFELLRQNVSHNDLTSSIECVSVCIGDQEGMVDLSIIEGKPEYSSVGGVVHSAVSNVVQRNVRVPITTLGNVVAERPISLLFIDVEGAEELVLRGAREILARDKPILYFECADSLLAKFGHSAASIETLLAEFGYSIRDGLHPNERLRHPFDGEVLAFVGEHLPFT